ncbi:hypothetical protein DM01DRAFT_329958 [Hesseltinella vesiculosa]|uniref:Protein kinase domain-containing protein n=1 Tax=Hesseltinella vesiculosa TaxID=101127 RepID=A0A1X2GQV8_9FUNG|nr:hypothetical protein DM01DRAFT_329958 [Hesseltinella vesiculosa]
MTAQGRSVKSMKRQLMDVIDKGYVYQDTVNYLRWWLLLAQLVDDPLAVYRHLVINDIGTTYALFYFDLAYCFKTHLRDDLADRALRMGDHFVEGVYHIDGARHLLQGFQAAPCLLSLADISIIKEEPDDTDLCTHSRKSTISYNGHDLWLGDSTLDLFCSYLRQVGRDDVRDLASKLEMSLEEIHALALNDTDDFHIFDDAVMQNRYLKTKTDTKRTRKKKALLPLLDCQDSTTAKHAPQSLPRTSPCAPIKSEQLEDNPQHRITTYNIDSSGSPSEVSWGPPTNTCTDLLGNHDSAHHTETAAISGRLLHDQNEASALDSPTCFYLPAAIVQLPMALDFKLSLLDRYTDLLANNRICYLDDCVDRTILLSFHHPPPLGTRPSLVAGCRILSLGEKVNMEVTRFLGKGVYGQVYQVRWQEQLYALKVLAQMDPWEFVLQQKAFDFVSMAVGARADFNPIVQYHALWLDPRSTFILMDFFPLGHLGYLIWYMHNRLASADVDRLAIFLTWRMLQAVVALHRNDLVHADIKLDNIMFAYEPHTPQEPNALTSDDQASPAAVLWGLRPFGLKLIDFGLALDLTMFPTQPILGQAIWKIRPSTDMPLVVRQQPFPPFYLDLWNIMLTVHNINYYCYPGRRASTECTEPRPYADLWNEFFCDLKQPVGHCHQQSTNLLTRWERRLFATIVDDCLCNRIRDLLLRYVHFRCKKNHL